jgi:hypothetical protein
MYVIVALFVPPVLVWLFLSARAAKRILRAPRGLPRG